MIKNYNHLRPSKYTKGATGLGSKPLRQRKTEFMCSACRNVWANKATSCLLCKKGEKVPYEAPGWNLAHVAGEWQACVDTAARGPGAAGPGGSIKLAHAPPMTSIRPQSWPWRTPWALQCACSFAMRSCSRMPRTTRSSTPDRTIRVFKCSTLKLLRYLISRHQPSKQTTIVTCAPERGGRGGGKATEEVGHPRRPGEEPVLQPFQEGLQSVADSEVYSSAVNLLRKSNLKQVQEKLKEAYFKESGLSSMKAFEQVQTTLAEAKAANKRMQEQGILWMKKARTTPRDLDHPDWKTRWNRWRTWMNRCRWPENPSQVLLRRSPLQDRMAAGTEWLWNHQRTLAFSNAGSSRHLHHQDGRRGPIPHPFHQPRWRGSRMWMAP